MELKRGVKVNGIKSETLLAMYVVNEVVREVTQTSVVITSCTDSIHGRASLHYVGYAFDIRIRDFTNKEVKLIVRRLKERLTDEYDIVVEFDHIHIEFQPKKI